jgi:hypothetical protein
MNARKASTSLSGHFWPSLGILCKLATGLVVLTITVDPVPGYFEQSRSICQIALFILRVKIVIGEVSLGERLGAIRKEAK